MVQICVLMEMNVYRLVWRITIRPKVVIRWLIASHLVIVYMFVGACFASLS